jgi:hypothetical protein
MAIRRISDQQDARDALCDGALFQVGGDHIDPDDIVRVTFNTDGEPEFHLSNGDSIVHDRFKEGDVGDLLADAIPSVVRKGNQSQKIPPPKALDLGTASINATKDVSATVSDTQSLPIFDDNLDKGFVFSYASSGNGEAWEGTFSTAGDLTTLSLANSWQPNNLDRPRDFTEWGSTLYTLLNDYTSGDQWSIQKWNITSYSQSGLNFEQEVHTQDFLDGDTYTGLAVSKDGSKLALLNRDTYEIIFLEMSSPGDLTTLSRTGDKIDVSNESPSYGLIADGEGRRFYIQKGGSSEFYQITVDEPWSSKGALFEQPFSTTVQIQSGDVHKNGNLYIGEYSAAKIHEITGQSELLT